jgi:tRNA(adenine34) deaminase
VNLDINLKQRFMREALHLAQRALDEDEVPVGAVIVHKNRIIAKSYNQTNLLKDPTAHAEMLAITQAAEYLKHDRLLDTQLYVTLEPCVMCIGAMIHARIGKLTFGARNVKYGACGSVINVLQDGRWNHEIQVEEGLMRDEAAALLQEFFKKKR